jgi:hypothetical protein
MSKVLLFDKIPMTSIKIPKEAIPALMHCLDTRFCVAIDMLESLLGVKEIEIAELKNKIIEPLKKNTPNVLALKPPVPGDQLTADDFMSMDDEDNVVDYLVFRSLRQRLAMLAQSPPGKNGKLEFTFHVIEVGLFAAAVDESIESLESKKFLHQTERKYLKYLKVISKALDPVYQENRARQSTYMKLPAGQQLSILEKILPPLKNPGEMLAGKVIQNLDQLGIVPESTLIAESLGYDEPDRILQKHFLKADYIDDEIDEEDECTEGKKTESIIYAHIIRIPGGDWNSLVDACDCYSGDILEAFEKSHDQHGCLVPPLKTLHPVQCPIWVLDYFIVEPGYEDAAAPCLSWFIDNIIRNDGPLVVYPVKTSRDTSKEITEIKLDESPEATQKIRAFFASMSFLPLPDTDYMYLNI